MQAPTRRLATSCRPLAAIINRGPHALLTISQVCVEGVKLIKTALYKQPDLGLPRWWRGGQCPGYTQLATDEYGENVHWYLTAPLAKKLLEIVDAIRKQGLDDR